MHVAIYLCTKFQSIWKTSDCGTKSVQKNMTNKNFGKINIKIVTYINVPLCKISVNLKIMGPNFLKTHE